MHREITCFKVHIAGRLSGAVAQGWIGTGGLLGCVRSSSSMMQESRPEGPVW